MASTRPTLTDDYALNAIRDRLLRDVAADLKARVMAIIEPEIDAACERAASSLKPTIEAYISPNHIAGFMAHVVKVVTEKRSPIK